MRKPELAAAIAEKTELSKEKASEVITVITEQIAQALSKGDSVSLIGFGTFEVRNRSARQVKTLALASLFKLLLLRCQHLKQAKA